MFAKKQTPQTAVPVLISCSFLSETGLPYGKSRRHRPAAERLCGLSVQIDLLHILRGKRPHGGEVAQLQAEHSDADQQARQLEESNQRLEARLGDKDALRGRLQGRLDAKEGRIQQLEGEIAAWREARRGELGRAGTVAGAAVRLNGLHGAAQQAAERGI